MSPRSCRRRRVVVAILASLVLVTTACGGGSEESAGAGDGLSITDGGGSTDADSGGDAAVDPATSEGDPAPEIAFTYFDGSAGTLDDFSGRPLVLNFFASWCAPCVAEMPEFQAVFSELDGQVAFLGFNVQDDPSDADALVEQTGVTYTLARDEDASIHQSFRGFVMPTTVFIAADGTVAHRWAGALTGEQLREIIAEEFGV